MALYGRQTVLARATTTGTIQRVRTTLSTRSRTALNRHAQWLL